MIMGDSRYTSSPILPISQSPLHLPHALIPGWQLAASSWQSGRAISCQLSAISFMKVTCRIPRSGTSSWNLSRKAGLRRFTPQPARPPALKLSRRRAIMPLCLNAFSVRSGKSKICYKVRLKAFNLNNHGLDAVVTHGRKTPSGVQP